MWLLISLSFILCIDATISIDQQQTNVLGKRLEKCSLSPLTGYYRSGKIII